MKTYVHKAYQPVIFEGIPDIHYSEDPASEYYQYWAMQFDRCINGYKPDSYAYIPGRLYFYLNFCKIKMADDDTNREVISHPFYRDLEHELSLEVDRAKKEHKGIIIPKSREKGITYDINGIVLLHEVVFYEGTEVAVGTAIPKDMEKDKIVLEDLWGELPKQLRSDRIQKNEEMWRFGTLSQVVSPDGKMKDAIATGIKSFIHFRPNFNRNINGFNSLRLSFAHYSEAGLINNLMAIHIKNKATFMHGTTQYGCPIYAGTAKTFDSKDNDYEKMYEAADDLDLIRFPVYARKALHGFIDYNTGKSDEVKAQAWVNQLYKKYEGDNAGLAKIQQEYPSEPEHFWMKKSGGLLPTPIINAQIKNITTDKKYNALQKQHGSLEIGKLRWKNKFGGEVEFIPDPRGRIIIAEHPIKGANGDFVYKNLDVGGVDPYNKVATVETDSMGACFLYRRFYSISQRCEMFILQYVDRPQHTEIECGRKFVEKDVFYNNLYKIAMYYGCKLLVEDTDEQLFSKFKEWNASGIVLARKPDSVLSVNSKVQKLYGVPPTDGVISKITDLHSQHLTSNPEGNLFLDLLHDLRGWGSKNTDLSFAAGYALIYDSDLNTKNIVVKENKDKPYNNGHFGGAMIRTEDGYLQDVTNKDFLTQMAIKARQG